MLQTFTMKASDDLSFSLVIEGVDESSGRIVFQEQRGVYRYSNVITAPRRVVTAFVDFICNRAKIEYPREENQTVSSMYGARVNFGIRPMEHKTGELHVMLDTPNVGVSMKMTLFIPSVDQWEFFKASLKKFNPEF